MFYIRGAVIVNRPVSMWKPRRASRGTVLVADCPTSIDCEMEARLICPSRGSGVENGNYRFGNGNNRVGNGNNRVGNGNNRVGNGGMRMR